MKVLLAAALAVSTLAGSAIAVQPAEASTVRVVVKPGYHHYHRGVYYRYYYRGRHYHHRVYKCVWRYHRKICKVRYW